MELRLKAEYIYYPPEKRPSNERQDTDDVEITGISLYDADNPDLEFPALTEKQYNFIYNKYLSELVEDALEQVKQAKENE